MSANSIKFLFSKFINYYLSTIIPKNGLNIRNTYIIHFNVLISCAKLSDNLDMDPDDRSLNERSAEHVSIQVVVLSLIVALCILERMNYKVDRTSNGRRTKLLMIAVIISNALFALSTLANNTMCLYCPAQGAVMMDTRWVMKWFNWLFLIHRAKLAQGMTPILSKKWFNKIVPGIITLLVVFVMLNMTASALQHEGWFCGTYSDNDDIQACGLAGGADDATDDETKKSLQSVY